MTTDDVRTQLSAYLDGELSEAERRAVEDALAANAALRRELDALRRTIELVRSLPRLSAPPGLGLRVQNAIRASRPAALSRWRAAALAAAAALILAAAATILLRPVPPRDAARHIPTAFDPAGPEAEGKAEAPAPPGPSPRPATAEADAIEELNGTRDEVALADRDTANRARHRAQPPAGGYGGAPADGRGAGARPPAAEPLLRKMAEERAVTARRHEATAEPRKERQAGAPATAKPAAALAEDAKQNAATPERAMADKAAPSAQAKKLGTELADMRPLAGDWGSPERERQNLLAAIERVPMPAEAALNAGEAREQELAATAPQPGSTSPATRRSIGAPPATAASAIDRGQVELRLTYTDLARCLDEVQEIFDGAALAYTVQPVGGGEFIVETSLPAPEARALLARLTGAPMEPKGKEKAQALAKGYVARPEGPDGLGQARRERGQAVRLVIYFVRAEGQAPAAAPAEPAQPSPPQK